MLKDKLQEISICAKQAQLMAEYTRKFDHFPILIDLITSKLESAAKQGNISVSFCLWDIHNKRTDCDRYIANNPWIRREYAKCELLDCVKNFFEYEGLNVMIRPTYELRVSWAPSSIAYPNYNNDDGYQYDVFGFFKNYYPEMITEK